MSTLLSRSRQQHLARTKLAADEAADWITEICASANGVEIIAARITALRMLEALLDNEYDPPAADVLRAAMARACDGITYPPTGDHRLRNYDRIVNG